MISRFWRPLLLFTALASLSAKAGQINWSGAFNRVNLTSTGAAMDSQMVFELGVFAAGFTPTEQNRASWAANWSRAALAFYNPNPASPGFTGSHPVTSNAAPFAAGTKGYIWGHDGACTNGEWILELAVNWTVSSATQVVTGQANGAGFQMKSAQASGPLPLTLWPEWRGKMFNAVQLNDPLISGAHSDPDADGVVNLAEYALGGHPLIAGQLHGRLVPGLTPAGGRARLALTITKRCHRSIVWGAGASLDLVDWPLNATTLLSETAEELVVRENLTSAASTRVFLRPVFSLP